MNWLDWLILIALAWAAIKGFSRGFIVELASLIAVVVGLWAAIHLSARLGEALGLDPDNTALAFLITFVAVLIGVHLLARVLTTLIDLAQLGLPNKLVGVVFGALRSVFILSVALNLLLGYTDGTQPSEQVREGSTFYGPVQATAPLLVPALGETKWVQDALDRVRKEME